MALNAGTITNTLTDARGNPIQGARVVAQLYPTGLTYLRADGVELLPSLETTTDASGNWSLTLEQNAGITPNGVVYQITETYSDLSSGLTHKLVHYVNCPAGTNSLNNAQTTAPTSVSGITGSSISFSQVTAALLDSGGARFNVKAAGAKGDGKDYTGLNIVSSGGHAVVTAQTSVFTSDMVTKLFWYGRGGQTPHGSTVLSFQSGTQITLAADAAFTESGHLAFARCLSQDDTSNITSAYNSAVAAVARGATFAEIEIPPGIYAVSTLPYSSYIRYVGSGRLSQIPGTAAPVFQRDSSLTVSLINAGTHYYEPWWDRVAIDATYNASNTGGILISDGIQFRVKGVRFDDLYQYGVRVCSAATTDAGGGNVQDGLIDNCRFILTNNFYDTNYYAVPIQLACSLGTGGLGGSPDGAIITNNHGHVFSNAPAIRMRKNGNDAAGLGGITVRDNRWYGEAYGRSNAGAADHPAYSRTFVTVPPVTGTQYETNTWVAIDVDCNLSEFSGNRYEYYADGNVQFNIGDGLHDETGATVSNQNGGANVINDIHFAVSFSNVDGNGVRGLIVTDGGSILSGWHRLQVNGDGGIRAAFAQQSDGLLRIHPGNAISGNGGTTTGALLHVDGVGIGASGAAYTLKTNASTSFYVIDQPTLKGDAATITATLGATLRINGAPIAGTNAAITQPVALSLGGPLYFDGTYTSASPIIQVNPSSLTAASGALTGFNSNLAVAPSGASSVNVTALSSTLTMTNSQGTSSVLIGFNNQVGQGSGGTGTVSEVRAQMLRILAQGASPGVISNAYNSRAFTPSFGGSTGAITNLYGYWVDALCNTNANTSAASGFQTVGVGVTIGNQGGNTSGTNKNYGLYVTGTGGTPSGGTVDNRAIFNDTVLDVVLANAALLTNAVAGFTFLPSCAGVPTGTPSTRTGTVPVVIDTTDGRLYAYYGSAWHQVALT